MFFSVLMFFFLAELVFFSLIIVNQTFAQAWSIFCLIWQRYFLDLGLLNFHESQVHSLAVIDKIVQFDDKRMKLNHITDAPKANILCYIYFHSKYTSNDAIDSFIKPAIEFGMQLMFPSFNCVSESMSTGFLASPFCNLLYQIILSV